MKFLVRNYSCLQNPRLEGYRPPEALSCPLSSTEFVEPPLPEKKFLGTPLLQHAINDTNRKCTQTVHANYVFSRLPSHITRDGFRTDEQFEY